MAQIQSIPKSRLKVNELLAFGQAIFLQISSANTDMTEFQVQFDEFQEAVNTLDASTLKITKSMWTDSMNALNKVRNRIRASIFARVRAHLLDVDGDEKNAAYFLVPLIDRYKYIYKHSFDDQTGYYYNLIEASRSDEFKKNVETLKLEASFTQLQTANNECAQSSSQRSVEAGERNMPYKTPVARQVFNTAYDNLVHRLNALAEVNGDDDYIKLFAWWNELIDKYRVTFSHRYGKGKGGKTASGSMSKHDPNTGGNVNKPSDRPGIL